MLRYLYVYHQALLHWMFIFVSSSYNKFTFLKCLLILLQVGAFKLTFCSGISSCLMCFCRIDNRMRRSIKLTTINAMK